MCSPVKCSYLCSTIKLHGDWSPLLGPVLLYYGLTKMWWERTPTHDHAHWANTDGLTQGS
jgi:hypothetical protein